jgi:putative hydrolase of the HAD superfamily
MFSKKNAEPVFQKFEEGKISEAEFYKQLRVLTGISAADNEIKNAWNSLLLHYRVKALSTLVSIKTKYQLFLLSNTNTLHQEKFTEIYRKEIGIGNFEDHFHKVYYSHEIGCRKPDKTAYEYVLKQNKLDPSHVLFIDDSIQNIAPAKELGMKTIHLEDGMNIEDFVDSR